MISIIYLRSSKPYKLVLLGRDDYLTAGPANDQMRYQTHVDFLKEMDTCILGTEKSPSTLPEQAKQHYLFFISNVVAKDRDLILPPAFFYRTVRELLRHHRRYLEFNKDL